MQEQLCPKCGYPNRANARFCKNCGQEIEQTTEIQTQTPKAPSSGSGQFISDMFDELGYLVEDVKGTLASITNAIFGKSKGGQNQAQPGQPIKLPSTRLIADSQPPKKPGEQVGGYVVLEAWPLQRSNYYKVRQIRCPQGHENPGGPDHCNTCQVELQTFLMRASSPSHPAGDNDQRQALVKLSQVDPAAILKHISIFDHEGQRCVVTEYPGDGWQSMAQLSLPVKDHALLVEWGLNLGQALWKLSEQGYIPRMISVADFIEPVLITYQRQARIADLTIFALKEAPASPEQAEALGESYQQKPIIYLSQLLYILASGKPQSLRRAPRDFSDLPPPFRGLVSRAGQAEFKSLGAFLETLRGALKVPESSRSLQQISGYRTDPGKLRDHNEDFVGKYSLGMQQTPDTPEVGLYLVADGMGGHQAGEVASKDVVRVILDEIQDQVQGLQAAPKLKRSTIKLDQVVSPGDVLRAAIQRANGVLYNARQQVGSDRGTTITATLIVGDACAIANVGDSRTYLLRDQQLEQITKDHSLVASLVAANMIQPDEVRSHPQRSTIYRTLGDRAEVEVDVHERTLKAGDRLLLCSDGLWEMVLDAEIHKIISQATSPQEVCDRLIDAANLGGGEDNISVVTVWLA